VYKKQFHLQSVYQMLFVVFSIFYACLKYLQTCFYDKPSLELSQCWYRKE